MRYGLRRVKKLLRLVWRRSEPRERGTQVGLMVVAEFDHERVPIECLLDDAPLHTAPPTVDESHFCQPSLDSGRNVLFDDGGDVPRLKRVKVQRVFDRDLVCHAPLYVAVTWVVMPPRAEKLPTTVIRLGAQAPTRSSRIWLVADS